jgi:50S ribosomal protein L16 3-hydroxylase
VDIEQYFSMHLRKALRENADILAWGMKYAVVLSDYPVSSGWLIDLSDSIPTCEPLAGRDADCTLLMASEDFSRILRHPQSAREVFASGRMAVTGCKEHAHHFPTLLAITGTTGPVCGIDYLIGSAARETYFSEYWPHKPWAVHRSPEHLDELFQIITPIDVESILDNWKGTVRLADKHMGKPVSGAIAKRHYQAGYHLAFAHVESHFPKLDAWGHRLRLELGLPICTYHRNLMYASPAGTGEGMHFDQNLNIVIQLSGRKLWRLAENAHVVHPNDRFARVFGTVSEDLALYSTLPYPDAMPDDAQQVEMVPGSVLLLPRGVWHETRSLEASLSLNFTFDQPSWVDVLIPEIRRALLRKPDLRAVIEGAATPSNARAKSRFRDLLRHLSDLPEELSENAIDRLKPVSQNPQIR